jgi:hypothetical protein
VQAFPVRKDVLPAASEVLGVLPGVDARLDIVAEQIELLHVDRAQGALRAAADA